MRKCLHKKRVKQRQSSEKMNSIKKTENVDEVSILSSQTLFILKKGNERRRGGMSTATLKRTLKR